MMAFAIEHPIIVLFIIISIGATIGGIVTDICKTIIRIVKIAKGYKDDDDKTKLQESKTIQ